MALCLLLFVNFTSICEENTIILGGKTAGLILFKIPKISLWGKADTDNKQFS